MTPNIDNILFINNADIAGGAALGTYRLHQELLRQGFTSRILVGFSKSKDKAVLTLPQKNKLAGLLTKNLGGLLGFQYFQNLDALQTPRLKEVHNADVINLHCTHNRQFNPLILPRLTRLKPTVWKFSDMWPFTGHCAYSFDCDRWKTGCGKCPYLATYPAIKRDTTHIQWKIKKAIYKRSSLDIIVPSIWMRDIVKNSMMSTFPIHHIPNGIDTDIFKPIDKRLCRGVLGLPQSKNIILIGSQSLKNDRKGGDLLAQVLNKIEPKNRESIVCLAFGQPEPDFIEKTGIYVYGMGYVESEFIKASIYSAADLLLFTTRADNSPLTVLESLACGTPCLAFDVGGVKELIVSGENGYVAKAFDTEELTSWLNFFLSNDDQRSKLGFNARNRILKIHKIEQQAENYLQIYKTAQERHSRVSEK